MLVKAVLLVVLIGGGAGAGFFFARRQAGTQAAAATNAGAQSAAEPGADGKSAPADGKTAPADGKTAPATGKAAEPETPPTVMELGQFLVNVEANGGLHYLRADVALEVDLPQEKGKRAKAAEGEEAAKDEKPKLAPQDEAKAKDAVVKVLSGARFESLRTPEGKEKVKTRLLDTLKERLPQQKIRGILFVSFVMQ